jgi:ribonucleotide reductase beta subunit family protein with ferritin-like domain
MRSSIAHIKAMESGYLLESFQFSSSFACFWELGKSANPVSQ